jgi:hypothetical protein
MQLAQLKRREFITLIGGAARHAHCHISRLFGSPAQVRRS